jgi:membrane protein implicated in regulation of membrane protease activity
MIGGAVLLGSELSFVNAQFYLVIIGAAAVLIGLITAALPGVPPWAQWSGFALLSVLAMLLIRSRLYRLLHAAAPAVHTGQTGGLLLLPVTLAPGESCQAEHAGSFWTVRNDGATPLPAGTRARIASVRGLTLLVRAEP